MPIYAEPQQLEVSIDGERVSVFTLPGVGRAGAAPPASRARGGERRRSPRSPPDAGQEPRAPAARRRRRADACGGRAGAGRRAIAPTATGKLRVPVKAGHATSCSRVPQADARRSTRRRVCRSCGRIRPASTLPRRVLGAYLRSVEIAGPFDPTGPGESPSRQRIFVCTPSRSAGASVRTRRAHARSSSTLARRAYRRPVTAADVEPLLAFYREGRARADFDAGIERALSRLLVSPEFLFRVEARSAADAAPDAPYRISDLELASRLSFFLWSSIPDDELLDARGAEAARRSGRARRSRCGGCWPIRAFDAFVEQLRRAVAVPAQPRRASCRCSSVFPDFDDTLRQAFRRETELFFDSIVREDRSALDLLRADYTFLNERLARTTASPNVKGSHFRRVTLRPDSTRGGLLGQGSILTVTSYPDRTSPVVRGKWILENLLGTPPPPPPPNVPPLQADRQRRRRAVDARADGAASRQPGVRELSRDDGSARLGARELRRGRQVARRSTSRRRPIDAIGHGCPTARGSTARTGCGRRCCGRTGS